jgi:hypothetical protein
LFRNWNKIVFFGFFSAVSIPKGGIRIMAVNKPVGDNARRGAVKKRTQLATKVMGKPAWTKRDKTSGEFVAVKKSGKKFKGVRKER